MMLQIATSDFLGGVLHVSSSKKVQSTAGLSAVTVKYRLHHAFPVLKKGFLLVTVASNFATVVLECTG